MNVGQREKLNHSEKLTPLACPCGVFLYRKIMKTQNDLNLHTFVHNEDGLIVMFAIKADKTPEGILVMSEVEDEETGDVMFELNMWEDSSLTVVNFDIKGDTITHYYDADNNKIPYEFQLTDDVAYAVRSNTAYWLNNRITLNLN